MAFLNSLNIVGSALTAERFRNNVILQNFANSQTTRTANGEPYLPGEKHGFPAGAPGGNQ